MPSPVDFLLLFSSLVLFLSLLLIFFSPSPRSPLLAFSSLTSSAFKHLRR